MKKTLELIAGIMLLLSITMMGFAQSPDLKVLQTWHYSFDPSGTTLPNGFKEKTSVWVNDITKKSYNYTVAGGWKEVNSGLYVAGPKGDKGDTGATGPQGPAGQAATITIGTTTTLPAGSNATVTNSGTSSNAVLNFGIPQGASGSGGGGVPTSAGTTRWVYNATELKNAIMQGDAVRNIEVMAEISLTNAWDSINLNTTAPSSPNIIINIDLNGNGIFDRTLNSLPYIFGMHIADQTKAMELANRPRTYIISNGKLVGKKVNGVISTKALIDISCSQFTTCQNLVLENAKKGIRLRFCMFFDIHNISSSDIADIVVEPTRGDWPGSGNNLCSSNQGSVRNVRAFVYDGSTAIIYSKACSGHKYELFTGEGGYAQYGIYWDYNGANEVKNGPEINLCHWEGGTAAQFSVAFIYIRQGGGSRTVINQTNHQLFAGTRSPLIWVQGEGGGNTVEVNNLSWLIADSKFQSTGQNFWKFNECYDGANLLSQSRWVGTIPNGVSTYNNGTSVLTVKRP